MKLICPFQKTKTTKYTLFHWSLKGNKTPEVFKETNNIKTFKGHSSTLPPPPPPPLPHPLYK